MLDKKKKVLLHMLGVGESMLKKFWSQENKLFTSAFISQLLCKMKTEMKQQTLKKKKIGQTPPGPALSLN